MIVFLDVLFYFNHDNSSLFGDLAVQLLKTYSPNFVRG